MRKKTKDTSEKLAQDNLPTARGILQGECGRKYKNKVSFVQGIRHSWQLYLCLLPAIIYLIVFHYVPLYGIQIAFKDFSPGLGFWESPWVGWKHFSYFVHSPQFVTLVRNTLALNVLRLLFCFPFPILLALVLNEASNARFQKVIQNITYAPHFISTVVLCGMIISFTAPGTGITPHGFPE